MKVLVVMTAVAALLAAAGGVEPSRAATPVSLMGLWSTGSEGGVVRIYACEDAVCARLEAADVLNRDPSAKDARNRDAAKRGRPLKGLIVLQGLRGGPTIWRGGPVYDPETGLEAAYAEATLTAEGALAIKGCKGPFCQTKVWRRAR